MRTVNYRWWRPVLGILAFVGSYVVAVFLVVLAFVAGGLDLNDLTRLDDLTDPGTLALANASLIVAIPTVWLAWVVHTERLGWSSSVLGRIRWRLLWRYGLLAIAILGVGILISLGVGGGIGSTTGFDGREYALLVVVVLISTPLQSAAEEYLFRGYASQAISSWIPSRTTGAVLAALITATLFSLAHAPGDIFTFLDRFAFGLAASAVVWLTGGLEAAIALHAANNVVIFLVIGALGGETSSDIQTGSGTAALIVALDILVMGIYVWIVAKTRERWHPEILSRAAEPADPAAPMAPPAHPPPNWGGGPPGWAGQPSYSPQYAPAPHPGLT
ncbi:MAG: CPBP family intramembrane glutamic endopeptidase [Geodermatophilaceae bacterium]